jgi:hypothetical protein
MNLIERKKFKEEFIYDLILYSDYQDISAKKTNTMTLDEVMKS